MSRIGTLPVTVPSGVDITINGLDVFVKGPKGELTQSMPDGVTLAQADGAVNVTRLGDDRTHRARHGLVRSLIFNMVEGVTEGYSKKLKLVGVGYRAALKGKNLELQVGFSHPVNIICPDGITIEVPAQDQIIVSGIDKAAVGQIAANIRRVRPPEPYKGKGIQYEGEKIRRKAGKAAGR
jgi:large subunit ribosomal protein L6